MGLRKLLRFIRRVFKKDHTPDLVDEEIEKRQRQAALKAFFARRGVEWPRPRYRVKLNNLYPDLTEFQPQPVKLINLYPDLSEFY
jgi:hypothetical protein